MLYAFLLCAFVFFNHLYCTSACEGKKFLVVIPSYNNEQWCERNLSSVFAQTYPLYRVVYIDDCSTDNTYLAVKNFIEKQHYAHNITLLRNTQRQGALANHYRAICMAHDDEIIVCLDGDDWFAHERVLEKLNHVYQDPYVWITYSQFRNWPTRKLGWSRPVPTHIVRKNEFRKFGFVSPQLRAYYAGLAKRVKLQDLLYKNNQGRYTFFEVAGDVALMFPMLEMAGNHFKYIPEILCERNVATPLNVFKVATQKQIKTTKFIKAQKPYKPLSQIKNEQHAFEFNMILYVDDFSHHELARLKDLSQMYPCLKHLVIVYKAHSFTTPNVSKVLNEYFRNTSLRIKAFNLKTHKHSIDKFIKKLDGFFTIVVKRNTFRLSVLDVLKYKHIMEFAKTDHAYVNLVDNDMRPLKDALCDLTTFPFVENTGYQVYAGKVSKAQQQYLKDQNFMLISKDISQLIDNNQLDQMILIIDKKVSSKVNLAA